MERFGAALEVFMAKEPKAARVLGRARSDAGRKIDDLVHSMPDDAFGAAQISSAGGAGTQRPLREPACEIPYRATSAKTSKMLHLVAFCCIERHIGVVGRKNSKSDAI